MKKILAVALLFVGFQANASVIQSSFDLEVITQGHTNLTLGSVFTVTSIYDDGKNYMTLFDDGVNGIGEFGLGDDTVIHEHCSFTNAHCTADHTGFAYFSDSSMDLSNLLSSVLASERGRDSTTTSLAWNFGRQSGVQEFRYQRDDVKLFGSSGTTGWGAGSSFRLDTFGIGTTGSANTWTSSFVVKSYTAVGVPEPSIIALFTAGLVGIGFARRRRS